MVKEVHTVRGVYPVVYLISAYHSIHDNSHDTFKFNLLFMLVYRIVVDNDILPVSDIKVQLHGQ